jgi:hypothetical protein
MFWVKISLKVLPHTLLFFTTIPNDTTCHEVTNFVSGPIQDNSELHATNIRTMFYPQNQEKSSYNIWS